MAYKSALVEYEKLRAAVTATQNPHRVEYLAAIQEWGAVAIWSRENDDQEQLSIAEAKIQDLESRLAKRKSKALTRDDQFVVQLDLPIIKASELGVRRLDELHYVVEDDLATITTWDHRKELWRDRIETVRSAITLTSTTGLKPKNDSSTGANGNR